MMEHFINKVFNDDALRLLQAMPTASVDGVITDPMYGTVKRFLYDWGPDPAGGNPEKHWINHEPIYQECRRVLTPGGVLAWAQGYKFMKHFDKWFGNHKVWSPIFVAHGLNRTPNIWVVQTKEQRLIDHPYNMLVHVDRKTLVPLKELHPCPKPVESCCLVISGVDEARNPNRAGLLLKVWAVPWLLPSNSVAA